MEGRGGGRYNALVTAIINSMRTYAQTHRQCLMNFMICTLRASERHKYLYFIDSLLKFPICCSRRKREGRVCIMWKGANCFVVGTRRHHHAIQFVCLLQGIVSSEIQKSVAVQLNVHNKCLIYTHWRMHSGPANVVMQRDTGRAGVRASGHIPFGTFDAGRRKRTRSLPWMSTLFRPIFFPHAH